MQLELGKCSKWYAFDLNSMLELRSPAGIALRLMIAASCCLGVWDSWKFARADYLFGLDTRESVTAATALVPDGWEYYMRLAQFDADRARELLEKAVRLNPYDAEADIELGLQYEAEERFDLAEKSMLAAFEVDHTYLPRWTLANYYFRRDDLPQFWAWARSAAQMPADDIVPLFQLCWRVSPDASTISSAILNNKPELVRQYLRFLLEKDQVNAAAEVATLLVQTGDPASDRPSVLLVVDRLVSANDGARASNLWNELGRQGWTTADSSLPHDGNFGRAPLHVSFEWYLPEYPGLHSWPGPSGLETEFDGREPEDCLIADQAIALLPGKYIMTYTYRTSGIAQATGIRWHVIDPISKQPLVDSMDLSSDQLQQLSVAFSVPAGTSVVRLQLTYQRPIGTPRISGMLDVVETQIRPAPQT